MYVWTHLQSVVLLCQNERNNPFYFVETILETHLVMLLSTFSFSQLVHQLFFCLSVESQSGREK